MIKMTEYYRVYRAYRAIQRDDKIFLIMKSDKIYALKTDNDKEYYGKYRVLARDNLDSQIKDLCNKNASFKPYGNYIYTLGMEEK